MTLRTYLRMRMNHRSILAISLGLLCFSCQRGRPARKELPPTLTVLPEIGSTVTPFPSRALTAQSSGYFIYSSDTSVLINGIRRDLLVLSFPDPIHDSTIGALIASGQSLAPFLLSQLHQMNKTGVIIDLRLSDNSPTLRQDYQVTSSALKEDNFPIIFLSDNLSAARAIFFTKYLEQFPDIAISRAGNLNDCFTPSHPTF
jgi:hypothetical protein